MVEAHNHDCDMYQNVSIASLLTIWRVPSGNLHSTWPWESTISLYSLTPSEHIIQGYHIVLEMIYVLCQECEVTARQVVFDIKFPIVWKWQGWIICHSEHVQIKARCTKRMFILRLNWKCRTNDIQPEDNVHSRLIHQECIFMIFLYSLLYLVLITRHTMLTFYILCSLHVL